MPTQYTIYLINNSASTQLFWCFLAAPEELVDDPDVYANSSTSLAVASMAQGLNTFTIPVQYVVGAGASNSAVGLNVRIDSTITRKTELTQKWSAKYATVPPNMGPDLALDGPLSPPNTIAIKSNAFNQAGNEANGWFSNMSYGIQTAQGFIGMTWSPSPQQTRTITPLLQFYVAVGSYGSSSLASWADVSNDSAVLTVPGSFLQGKTTVTYTEIGGWEITPGAPPTYLGAGARAQAGGNVSSLIQSHKLLTEAHARLIGLTKCDAGGPVARESAAVGGVEKTQPDELVSVKWDSEILTGPETVLTGTLTVSTALLASFTVFVLSGLNFKVKWIGANGTTVGFSYSGSESAHRVKSLFVAGARLLFS